MIVDGGKLGRVKPAPGGGILVEGLISRSGVQVYRRPDGSKVRAYRPPDEVRAADFRGSPLTVGHPPAGVSPENYKDVTVGTALERSGEELIDGQVYPRQELQVNDAATIADVTSGRLCELSCGYQATRDWTPGIADGVEYDVVFRDLKPNHIALGGPEFARAGRNARLLTNDSEVELMADSLYVADSAGANKPLVEKDDRDALLVENAELRRTNAQLVADAKDAVDALDAAKAELDAAKAELAKLPAKIADGIAFRDAAKAVLGNDYTFDGKDEAAVRADIRAAKVAELNKLDPEIKVNDSTSDVYLDAYLDAARKFKAADSHEADYRAAGTPAPVQDGADMTSYIAQASADAYKVGR